MRINRIKRNLNVRNWSIRTKFTIGSTAIAVIAVIVASTSFLYYQSTNARESLVRELSAVAEVIGINMTAPVVFGDPAAGREILKALQAKTDILSADIELADGSAFARYIRPQGSRTDVMDFKDTIVVARPIVLDGTRLGQIRVVGSLATFRQDQRTFIWIAAAIAFLSALVGLALAFIVQRGILKPILGLVSTMRDISQFKDYGTRAKVTSRDELGTLIRGFNDMLSHIETQHMELSRYRQKLEERVAVRTKQLTRANARLKQSNEELREAKAKAEAANQAKSQFLTNMSHELRTPLNAVIGFSELMRTEIFGPLGDRHYRDYIADIEASGSHLLNIINDILDMTKIEVGNFTLNESVVSLRRVLLDSHRLIRRTAEQKGISFPAPKGPEQDVAIQCDVTRIRQVLLNLLSNAVKFTDDGGTIELAARADDDAIVIEVGDNGIGIPSEQLENVLSPFGQVENSYARNHEGVGLGLSLSQSLVNQHGGRLSIRSILGEGTTVEVRLPKWRIQSTKSADTGAIGPLLSSELA